MSELCPDGALRTKQTAMIIRRTLDSLPETQRIAFVLTGNANTDTLRRGRKMPAYLTKSQLIGRINEEHSELSKRDIKGVLETLANVGYTELKRKWSEAFEKEFLVASLSKHGGNVSAAAREAKLDRSNFLRLLRRHGLKAQEYRKGQPQQPAVAKVA